MKTYKISLLTSILLSSSVLAASEPHYSIIVDAGSSGSRLHLFQYTNDDNNPMITEIFSEETKPGLSAYANHPEQAGPSLKKLFDDASKILQTNQIDEKNVSVDILATAGMRLLPEKTQVNIYSNIIDWVSQHSLFSDVIAKTIPGKMEGIYDWLDVNYLENTFSEDQSTLGVIDMGGASTQIAFATRDQSKPDDEKNVTIRHHTYTVFSKSFLGLGQDQARLAMSSDPQSGNCYPTGYQSNIFDFQKCSVLYQNVIKTHQVELLPLNHIQFAIFSGAYYDYNFFGVEDAEQAALEARIRNICSMSWDDMKKEYADSHIPESYLSAYCANGIYVDQLFYNTYHLTGSQMWVTNKSHQGKNLDWSVGAMLYRLIK